MISTLIVISIAVVIFVIFISVVMLSKALINPLKLLEERVKDLSQGEGDLTQRVLQEMMK